MGKKPTLTAEQRTQLVLRLLSKEEPAAQVARRAGISEQTLYRWREEWLGCKRGERTSERAQILWRDLKGFCSH